MGSAQRPFWLDRDDRGDRPARVSARAVTYDVAVLGAGIVGATAALEAVERGMSAVIVDAEDDAGRGASGQATATVTAGHGTRAVAVERAQGEAVALEYLRAADAGLARVRAHAALLPAADARECDHDVYASDERDAPDLMRSAELARAAGIDVRPLDPDGPALPVAARAAVRYPGQLLIDPVAYVRGLLRSATALGCDALLGAPVTGFDAGDPHEVMTRRGAVRARHVIVATHVPVFHRSLAFARVVQRRRFAVAGEVDAPVAATDDVSGRFMSTRPAERDGRRYAIVAGSSVGTDHATGVEAMHAVCAWAETHAGIRLTHAWASEDCHPADELPLVGGILGTPRMWIATGFAGWGLTLGTVAGGDLVRHVAGETPLAPSWRPDRVGLVRGLMTLASIGAWTAKGLVVDALALPPTDLVETAASLSPGQGRVVRDGLSPYAVCMDRAGTVHIVSGRCSHLGCVVAWDAQGESWECPCHGSRFAPDGRVLHGPAMAPLAAYGVSRERPSA